MEPRYLGDGVYLRSCLNGLEIFTHNGINDVEVIFLEPEVAVALCAAIKEAFTIPQKG